MYTLKEVEDAARELRNKQTGEYWHVDSAMDQGADILDAYAATLKAAQGGVTDDVVDRVAKAIADAAGHGMREKCEHMAHAAIAAYRLATWNTAPPAMPSGTALVPSPPANCRERLQREGKPYPRSSCAVCGKWAPKWRDCDVLLQAASITASPAPSEGEKEVDGDAARYAFVREAFVGMTTSQSERFLELLGIEGDVFKPLDDAIDTVTGAAR